ncbi:YCF48-related protein [Thalassoroseus pseudoceratinae]|uniref:YCF48-related protein n=1 Tax=Thalassoroseus pseudoceratinae TaxID=2713176 RepID=UPI00141F4AD0|nr:YCF48-related protein [Thalassoroseus pseudoceratinae]
MSRMISLLTLVLVGYFLTLETQAAPPVFGASRGASPLQDDAALRDVQFVGSKIGWCVGDQSTIWQTSDGGRFWSLVSAPVRANFRSVCFLTDRVGWIAGGGFRPHTRQSFGVILATNDGGASWQVHERDGWPNFQYVRFFSLQDGIAVGEATSKCPTGILTTQDGGESWQPMSGESRPGWRAAEFLQPEIGIVAGMRGQVSLVGGDRLLATQVGNLGLRTVRQVRLTPENTGWLVGDGGLVRTTDNGGVSWGPPTKSLPREVRDCLDFHAVAVRGAKVWIAGRPGGVVWHSPDGGASWQKQPTGQTVPIHDLEFVDDNFGWAIGDLGMMLATGDGGKNWVPVRGANRRAAVLTLVPRPERISFPLLTTLAAEQGYRSVVHLPARDDVGTDGESRIDFDLRTTDAVTAVGANTVETGWRFPLAVPELEAQMTRLIADWNNRAEGKFPDVFLGSLVLSLRTWQPDVVIVDMSGEDDAVGRLLFDAIQQAITQAADPTRYPSQQDLAGVSQHQVRRLFFRQPSGSVGDVELDPHAYLPQLGTSAHTAAVAAQARLMPIQHHAEQREPYRLLLNDGLSNQEPHGGDFFAGLDIAPGSASRRSLKLVDPSEDMRREELFKKQRNFQAYAARMLDDPRHAAQVIAQLSEITRGMTDQEAALQLTRLADQYRQQSRWDLVEATSLELVERFPHQPAAIDAMRWLFQLWSGSEPAWQRARETQVSTTSINTNVYDVRSRIEQALIASEQTPIDQIGYTVDRGPDPVKLMTQAGTLRAGKSDSWRNGAVKNWHDQAIRMAALMRQLAPALYAEPEVQFQLAAMMRARGSLAVSDPIYGRFAALPEGSDWQASAATEIWLNAPGGQPPKELVPVQKVRQRPLLDALLSDDCWQAASILTLRDTTNPNAQIPHGGAAFAMLAYDTEFLYIAASIPKVTELEYDSVQLAGREHDADLSGHDRIRLMIDTDRDYATWYTMEVDQRGWTRDACWDDQGFNPKWHVAAEADEKHWRIECAIPLTELLPKPPQPGQTWSVGIDRIIPGVGLQSWTLPAGETPKPHAFGLVQFQ